VVGGEATQAMEGEEGATHSRQVVGCARKHVDHLGQGGSKPWGCLMLLDLDTA
jgi:hypothetical protein